MAFKQATVTPLLKKPSLDASDPKNYRFISNLNTLSKVLERLSLSRLSPHISSSSTFSKFQSAYRRGHSTETAMLKVLNDLYVGVNNKAASVLLSLDLSAAFDTVDIIYYWIGWLLNLASVVWFRTGCGLIWRGDRNKLP